MKQTKAAGRWQGAEFSDRLLDQHDVGPAEVTAEPVARLFRHGPARGAQVLLFFFHAEDGIRVLYVTGVQTCALPIFAPRWGMYTFIFYLRYTIAGWELRC